MMLMCCITEKCKLMFVTPLNEIDCVIGAIGPLKCVDIFIHGVTCL